MAKHVTASAHLQLLASEASTTRAFALRAVADLNDEQLAWRPDEKSWCIAECFDHLRKVDRPYLKALDQAIRQAPLIDAGIFRPSMLGRIMMGTVAPNARMKVPAPRKIRPQAISPADARKSIEAYLQQQAELMTLIQHAEGRDINSPRVPTPISSLIALSIGEALTVLVRHGERHRLQAERIMGHAHFPDSASQS